MADQPERAQTDKAQTDKAQSAVPAPATTSSAQDGQTSWWRTIPGMLTAAAGLVTAITGLVIALDKIGIFADDAPAAVAAKTADVPNESAGTAPPASTPASTPGSGGPSTPAEEAQPQPQPPADSGTPPARSATLVATMTDGTTMSFDTNSWSHSQGVDKLNLDNGLSISLSTIRAIDFGEYTGGNTVDVKVTLYNGQIVSNKINAGSFYLAFKGKNDIGELTMRTDKLRRIGPPPIIKPDLIKVQLDRAQLAPVVKQ
jgi:hypothetical protein